MPPTFAYAMILFAYVCFGGVALAIAVILAIAPGTRRLARRLAGGVIGSYPGVFLFQILAVPLLAAVWGACWMLRRVFPQPDNQFGAVALITILFVLGIFACMSILGFITGWSAGSGVALGVPLGAALRRTWIARWARKHRWQSKKPYRPSS